MISIFCRSISILIFAALVPCKARAAKRQIPVGVVSPPPPPSPLSPPPPSSVRLFSPFCERFLVSSLQKCDRVMMRKLYPGQWNFVPGGRLESENSIRKKCTFTSLGTDDRDNLAISFDDHEFEIIPVDERFSVIFDFTVGGFLQVNQNCIPFIESDDDVGENDNDVDDEKLLWIVS